MSVPNMKHINVAVIGTGFGELVHIPGYNLHPHYEMKGIWGRITEKTSEVAMKNNIHAYSSLEEILDDTKIDLVSIAAIPKLHYPYAKAAIDKGKHVILEKPMAMDSVESLALLSAAKQQNVFLYDCKSYCE
jgi:predicted dehydrogenase